MIYYLGIVLFLAAFGVLYEVVVAPRVWMRNHGDGLYNAKVRFYKNNLNVKGD